MVHFPNENCKSGEGVLSERQKRLNEFIDTHQGPLCRSGRAMAARLWLTLWRFEYGKDGTVRVGMRKLAERLGTTPSSVRRSMTELHRLGYVATVQPGSIGRGECAVYEIMLPDGAPEGAHGAPLEGTRRTDKGRMARPEGAHGANTSETDTQTTSKTTTEVADATGSRPAPESTPTTPQSNTSEAPAPPATVQAIAPAPKPVTTDELLSDPEFRREWWHWQRQSFNMGYRAPEKLAAELRTLSALGLPGARRRVARALTMGERAIG
jgi:hypothetical protein